MTVVFPPNPNVGDTVLDAATGSVWLWDGAKWTFVPSSTGPIVDLPAGDFRTFTGPSVTWVNSGDVNSLGTFTLGPGDWDVTGFIIGNPSFGNLLAFQPAAFINGASINTSQQLNAPNIAPGLLWPSMGSSYRIPLATFRAFDPDAEMAIEYRMTLNYSNTVLSPTNQLTMLARKWSDDGTGIVGAYLQVLTPPVTWSNSGDTNTVGNLALPAGDWDVGGVVGTNMPFANNNGFAATGYVNDVAIPLGQFAPFLQGTLTQGNGTYELPMSIIRVNSPDAAAVRIDLQLTYDSAAGAVTGRTFLRARRWS